MLNVKFGKNLNTTLNKLTQIKFKYSNRDDKPVFRIQSCDQDIFYNNTSKHDKRKIAHTLVVCTLQEELPTDNGETKKDDKAQNQKRYNYTRKPTHSCTTFTFALTHLVKKDLPLK
jgi:hypothetical protein